MTDTSGRAVDRKTARAQRYYDAHAGGYDRQIGVAERRLLGRHREWATSRASGAVLELAVGTGLNLPLYSEAATHVLGVDLSAAMLGQAQDRLRAHGLGDRAEVRSGDVQHLDLPDASFDTVVATYALCSTADPRAALLEAWRILRPGGRLLLVEHGPSRWLWLRAVQHALDPLTVRWQSDHLLRAPQPLVQDTGFEVTQAEQLGVGGLAHRVDARKPEQGPAAG